MARFARHWGTKGGTAVDDLIFPLVPKLSTVMQTQKVQLLVPGNRNDKNWSWINSSRLAKALGGDRSGTCLVTGVSSAESLTLLQKTEWLEARRC